MILYTYLSCPCQFPCHMCNYPQSSGDDTVVGSHFHIFSPVYLVQLCTVLQLVLLCLSPSNQQLPFAKERVPLIAIPSQLCPGKKLKPMQGHGGSFATCPSSRNSRYRGRPGTKLTWEPDGAQLLLELEMQSISHASMASFLELSHMAPGAIRAP